jgi:hypothetical protein
VKTDLTKRSISQVIFRHTPKSLIAIDEYSVFGMVTEIKGTPDPDINRKLLYKQVLRFADKWRELSNGRVKGFESYIEPDSLLPIRPTEGVYWDLFPTTFECINKNCRVIIDRFDEKFTGKCLRCGSGLRQFRYVWFHICGHIRPFQPIKQVCCPTHKRKYLYLNDTGRFKTSTWRCRECTYEKSLGMLPCMDELCKKYLDPVRESKYLRASVWNDPWIYFTQVVPFVNLSEQQIKPIIESEMKEKLMTSALLGSIEAGQGRLAKKSLDNKFSTNCVKCGSLMTPNAKFCSECGAKQPEIDKETSDKLLPGVLGEQFKEDSELAIFTALRDLERTVSLKDEKNRLKENPSKSNNIERAYSLENALESLNMIGIYDALLIGDFPITYTAIGYSRFQSKPPAWLNSFPPSSISDTKIPIYTNCITTEAWLIQLSAKYVLDWFIANNLMPESTEIKDIANLSESDSKLWLLDTLTQEVANEKKDGLYSVIKELVHSLAHTFLQSLTLESGLDIASFGEVLLPTVLSFIIYGGETDLGGLTASFNQGLNSLIDSLTDYFRYCKFDPSCSEDDDGACVGCLYIPRSCAEFNEGLSRTYLFGGSTRKLAAKNIAKGYFDLGK